jgi:hypothetical protein
MARMTGVGTASGLDDGVVTVTNGVTAGADTFTVYDCTVNMYLEQHANRDQHATTRAVFKQATQHNVA